MKNESERVALYREVCSREWKFPWTPERFAGLYRVLCGESAESPEMFAEDNRDIAEMMQNAWMDKPVGKMNGKRGRYRPGLAHLQSVADFVLEWMRTNYETKPAWGPITELWNQQNPKRRQVKPETMRRTYQRARKVTIMALLDKLVERARMNLLTSGFDPAFLFHDPGRLWKEDPETLCFVWMAGTITDSLNPESSQYDVHKAQFQLERLRPFLEGKKSIEIDPGRMFFFPNFLDQLYGLTAGKPASASLTDNQEEETR